jgi:hypothetical protein
MSFYVYILASRRNGTLYAGMTDDLIRRIWQHRTGAVPGFTSISIRRSPLFSCQTAEFSRVKRKSSPVSALGQGIALIPLSLTTLTSRGMARRQGAWPGLLRAVSGLRRTVGVKRHAPRLAARQRGIFGLRLSQRSGRTRSCLSLAGVSRGRPWVRLA